MTHAYRPMPSRWGAKPMPRKPLTAAQQALASDPRHIQFAERMAHSYIVLSPPVFEDDIHSAAFYGLVLAAQRYDPDRGFRFLTFASSRILGAIKDTLRASIPRGYQRDRDQVPRVQSFGLEWDRNDGNCLPLIPGSAAACAQLIDPVSDDSIGWEVESEDEVKRLSRMLPGRMGMAVRLYYLHGCAAKMKETGQIMGSAESGVSQMLSRANEMLGEQLGVRRENDVA